MTNDIIGDMIARIRNSLRREVFYLELPSSNILEDIASILLKEGYLEKFETKGKHPKKILALHLKKDAIKGLERISKPSRRIYANLKNMPRVREGLGTAILSTSKGVLSDRMAKKEGVGGEVLFYLW